MRSPARSHGTDALSRFHSARAQAYQALHGLLRAPPSEATLEAARQGGGRIAEAVDGVAAAAAAEEWTLLGASLPGRCTEPDSRVRGDAFSAVGVAAAEDRASELLVLAHLARRTTEALAAGNLPEASILTDVQGRFIAGHAGGCLDELAARLCTAGLPVASRVGEALRELVEEDLRLLGYPWASPSRSPP